MYVKDQPETAQELRQTIIEYENRRFKMQVLYGSFIYSHTRISPLIHSLARLHSFPTEISQSYYAVFIVVVRGVAFTWTGVHAQTLLQPLVVQPGLTVGAPLPPNSRIRLRAVAGHSWSQCSSISGTPWYFYAVVESLRVMTFSRMSTVYRIPYTITFHIYIYI